MNNFVLKISSRKLWVALAGIATGIAMVLGVNESEIGTVSGVVLALASAVTYIFTEGKIDAERVKKTFKSEAHIIEGGEISGS